MKITLEETAGYTFQLTDRGKLMNTVIVPQRTLHDDLTLPGVGFGTYQLNGQEGVETIARAIRNGYRLLDSAFNYENEGAVGEAVRRSGVARSELRITSKLIRVGTRSTKKPYRPSKSLYSELVSIISTFILFIGLTQSAVCTSRHGRPCFKLKAAGWSGR